MRCTYIAVFYFIASFLLSACGRSYEKELTNGYWLWGADTKDDAALMVEIGEYQVGVVSARITAYMQNESYIAVIQENTAYGDGEKNDEKRYFIIPFKNKVSDNPEKNFIGPLSREQFMYEVKRLDGSGPIKFLNVN